VVAALHVAHTKDLRSSKMGKVIVIEIYVMECKFLQLKEVVSIVLLIRSDLMMGSAVLNRLYLICSLTLQINVIIVKFHFGLTECHYAMSAPCSKDLKMRKQDVLPIYAQISKHLTKTDHADLV